MQRRVFPNLMGESLFAFHRGKGQGHHQRKSNRHQGFQRVYHFHGETGMMPRSCKVSIVAVIGPLTMLHLDFFLILAETAAHARATSILPSLCTISSHWSSSQVRSWSNRNQIAGSPLSPKRKCRIAVVRSVLILLPHESAAMVLLCWIELEAHAHCSMSVRRSWQDHSFEQLRCLVFGFQIVLYHLDVGVSFATLLLPLGSGFLTDLLRPAFASRPTNIAHRNCSFKGNPLLQQLTPNSA